MKKYKHGGATFRAASIAVSTVLFAVCANQTYRSGEESKWVIVLFSIPLVVQGLGWLALYAADSEEESEAELVTFHNFCAFMMLISTLSYCTLWIAYLSGFQGKPISYVAAIWVLLLVGSVILVTSVIMRPATKARSHTATLVGEVYEWMRRLRDALVMQPFWAFSHFFTIFLTVAFLFGFLLAFHDRSFGDSAKPPLYKAALAYHQGQSGTNRSLLGESCFHFAEGKAELEMMPPTDISTVIRPIGPKEALEIDRRRKNYEIMKALVDKVIMTLGSTLVRITLIGRANEKPTRTASYLSNYELSQARSQAVRYEILRALIQKDYQNWRNVEWVVLPLSNEQSAKTLGHEKNACNPDGKDNRLVEASVESLFSLGLQRDQNAEFERLDLMGYMYFSIYTITTTGYGDVIPTTPYAKFVTSLANVFAIFFLVGFINALISLKTQRKDP